MNRTAKCQCGRLQAEVTCDPLIVIVCHCEDCQLRTGSAFSYNAYFNKAEVHPRGQTALYEREGFEGRKIRYYFCPNCGTSVYWELDLLPDAVGIAATLFREKSFPAPTRSIWEKSKREWAVTPPGSECRQMQ